jgi:hypothetical protein
LSELLGLNFDSLEPCPTKDIDYLANNWIRIRSLVLAKELLHKRPIALKSDMPLAVIGPLRIAVRVATYAH